MLVGGRTQLIQALLLHFSFVIPRLPDLFEASALANCEKESLALTFALRIVWLCLNVLKF
jgi:hypothetical protein